MLYKRLNPSIKKVKPDSTNVVNCHCMSVVLEEGGSIDD